MFAAYFTVCLLYLYFVAFTGKFDLFFWVAFFSLAIEGFIVFILNKGRCPFIHIQRKIGDSKPFFELFFPPKIAKLVIPIFAVFTVIALGLLIIRLWLT